MPRAAGRKPARPPGMETSPAERTKMVRRRPAKKTLPGVARAGPLAAALLRGFAARLLAAAPRAVPLQSGIPPDAAERPARCGDQGAPMALAGGVGREVASWARAPRPSARRPRKVSR